MVIPSINNRFSHHWSSVLKIFLTNFLERLLTSHLFDFPSKFSANLNQKSHYLWFHSLERLDGIRQQRKILWPTVSAEKNWVFFAASVMKLFSVLSILCSVTCISIYFLKWIPVYAVASIFPWGFSPMKMQTYFSHKLELLLASK